MDVENDLQVLKIGSEVSNAFVHQSERELLHLTASALNEGGLNREDLSGAGNSTQPVDQDFDGNNAMSTRHEGFDPSAVTTGHPMIKQKESKAERSKRKKEEKVRKKEAKKSNKRSSRKHKSQTTEVSSPEVKTPPVVRDIGKDREILILATETVSADESEIDEPKSEIGLMLDFLDSQNEVSIPSEEVELSEVADAVPIILNEEPEERSETPITPVQEYQRAISGAITVAPGAASNARRWWELNNFAAGESTRDIEADFVKSETFVVAGMSIRGASHQENGAPNQDAFSITFARDYLVAVVSDGVSAAKHSGYGSRYMSTKVSRRIAFELDQQSSELDDLDIQKIITRAISESAKSLMNWTVDSFEAPTAATDEVKPQDMAATLTVAVIPNGTNSENQRKMTLAFIGDSPCYILAEDTWNIMTPATKEGLIVENSTSWVPGSVVGDVTPAFVVFEVRDQDVILLMTDGVSTSLGDGSYPVAQFLGPRLAKPQNMGDYFDSLNFDRRGEADDRTLVAIYSQTSISGSNL